MVTLLFEISRFHIEPADCVNSTSIFKSIINGNTDALSLISVKLEQKWCPIWFQGIQLPNFNLENFKIFSFVNDQILASDINANITNFFLKDVFKLQIDHSVLNTQVFSRLKSIFIDNVSIKSVNPPDIFRSFQMLRLIEFGVINMKGFLHSTNGTLWIEYLNYNAKYDLDRLNHNISRAEIEFILSRILALNFVIPPNELADSYLFPYIGYYFEDRDFCLFARFPHNQLVVPHIQIYSKQLNCSCTLVWLLKYTSKFYPYYNLTSTNEYYMMDEDNLCNYENNKAFNDAYQACDFENRLSKCQFQVVNYHDAYFDMYDIKNAIISAKNLLIVQIGPLASSIGLLSNILIVAILFRNRHVKRRACLVKDRVVLLDNSFYKYILANSIVCIIYCTIFLLDTTIVCTPTPFVDYDIFYFNKYTHNNCLIKRCTISFIGSSLKILSNFILIQISINRYTLIGRGHSKKLVSFSQIGTVKFLVIFSSISFLLSIIVVFQLLILSHPRSPVTMHQDWFVNESHTGAEPWLYKYEYYPFYLSYFTTYNNKSSIVKQLNYELPMILTFTVIHDMFSYALFCILSLVIDVLTAYKLRETIKKHREMIAQINTTDNSNNIDRAEIKSIVMIIMNSVVNFILRSPELLSIVAFVFFDLNPYVFKSICLMFNQCLTLYDLSNIFFFLSMSFCLIFYVKFNNCFRDAFYELLNHVLGRFFNPLYCGFD